MLKVTISWWRLRELAAENPDAFEMIRSTDPDMPDLEQVKANKGYHNFSAFLNDLTDLPDEIIKKCEFEPVRPLRFVKKNGAPETQSFADALKVAQVHMPGNELLKIREVKNENDLCTVELDKLLAEDWRIIAVCIQPDQRRPDYILGREFRPSTF